MRSVISLVTLTRDYVCAQCGGPLTIRWEEGTGSYVACAANPGHYGVWRKSYLEYRRLRAKAEGLTLAFDEALQAMFDWWPRPGQGSAVEAMADLYE